MVNEIKELYEYNSWANQRVLGATARLSPGQLTRDLRSSFPSVLDTLVHTMGAEWIWLSRWKGTSPTGMPEEWDFPTHEALSSRWISLDQDLTDFASALSAEQLAAPLAYRNTRGEPYSAPLWQLMRHLVNHGSYHRGQVVTLLRQLGAEAVATDLVLFHRERDGGAG
jgi:uncharacterized damage-inducible protein DinB